MRPVRVPAISSKAEDADTKGVGESPRFLSSMFSGGRLRRPSLSGESLGCLSLLDEGEQVERPRAFPSPGLAGEILPSCSLKVIAQPTIHVQRPRAVLSSPENDELQGQQVEKSITSSSALKAMDKDLPIAALSSTESIDPLALSKEAPKAVVSPPDEFIYMGDAETSVSDEASSCSTSSNLEHSTGLSLSREAYNELAHIKHSMALTPEVAKEKKFTVGLPPKSRHEQSGDEENVVNGTAANRSVKKHNSSPSNTSRTTPKRHSSLPLSTVKGNSGRILRPWY